MPYADIANLFHRYAEYVDAGDFAGVAKLFAHCTIYDPYGNELAKGSEQVLAMYSNMVRIYPDDETPHTHHVLSNLIVEAPQANSVRARANYTVLQKMSSGKIETIMGGQYRDCFEHRDDQWCFSEHHMHPKFVGDMSEHLLFELDMS